MKTKTLILTLVAGSLIIFSCSRNEKQQTIQEQDRRDLKQSEPLANEDYISGDKAEVSKKNKAEFKNNGAVQTYNWNVQNGNSIGYNNAPLSSSAASTVNDAGRKFIRTAEIKFMSKNVISTSYEIEDIITRSRGFVSSTNLRSIINDKTSVKVSPDSALETTKFTFENTMMIRVPNKYLDTTLKSIAKLVDFMDYRVITADDATMRILATEQEEKRSLRSSNRIKHAVDTRPSRIAPIVDAEENISEKERMADEARIAGNELNDQVNFSTISLSIYQNQEVKSEMVALFTPIKPYQPPFSEQFTSALNGGLDILKSILLVLARLWFILIIGIAVYYTVRILRAQHKRITASIKN